MTDVVGSRFVLASSSPRRKALLEQAGYSISSIVSPDIDEEPLKKELPNQLSARLSVEKNYAVRRTLLNDSTIILSADTVVACGRTILPKPEDRAQAQQCLKMLSGRSNKVFTSISVSGIPPTSQSQAELPPIKLITKTVSTVVKFKVLNAQEIAYYLDSGEWKGKAGGYSIQGYADCFIRNINGSYSNVVGLPLYTTTNILKYFGAYPILAKT